MSFLARHLSSVRVAPLFVTEPVSSVPQPDYLNTALVGHCSFLPEELLGIAKSLELAAGRRPSVRFGPRPLDIDLLVFGDRVQRHSELTLPHPRLSERWFYLEPLARIAPDLRVPPENRTVAELLEMAPRTGTVREVRWSKPIPGLEGRS